MAIYITVDKVEEKMDEILYKYCSNNIDWGLFSVNINDVMDMKIIELAKNDPDKKYIFRAWSAVKKDLNEEGQFPDRTCYAA